MGQGQGLRHVLEAIQITEGFPPKETTDFKQGKLSFVILKVYSGCCVDYLKRILQCKHFIISSASQISTKNGLLREQLVSQNIIILF